MALIKLDTPTFEHDDHRYKVVGDSVSAWDIEHALLAGGVDIEPRSVRRSVGNAWTGVVGGDYVTVARHTGNMLVHLTIGPDSGAAMVTEDHWLDVRVHDGYVPARVTSEGGLEPMYESCDDYADALWEATGANRHARRAVVAQHRDHTRGWFAQQEAA